LRHLRQQPQLQLEHLLEQQQRLLRQQPQLQLEHLLEQQQRLLQLLAHQLQAGLLFRLFLPLQQPLLRQREHRLP
jgi:hypothetical protein